MRLGLGTVQFGLPYGVSNHKGIVPEAEVQSILKLAQENKIDTLDTAVSYGESEHCLGIAGVRAWKIVSKLPPIPHDCENVDHWITGTVKSSLQRLTVSRLHGLLLHRPAELLETRGEVIYRTLENLKNEGLVQKIGISIYEPAELDVILSRYDFDLVQAPFSILDRRLADTGWMDRLHKMGTELHVRSIFLQGLLLMPPALRPKKFDRWGRVWTEWARWLAANNLDAVTACLRFANSFPKISKIIIGVDSEQQLKEAIRVSAGKLPDCPPFCLDDSAELLNPARWSELQ
jgi:aryl-alcohol dehydrogenase-like predicted oxidoreductase